MHYIAKGLHNRHFELFGDKGTCLGKLDYTSWFSLNAGIQPADSTDKYDIAHASLWLTSIHVLKNDLEWCKLKFNWKGQIIMQMTDGRVFVLKHHFNFLKNSFTLEDEHNEILALKPDFNFAKMSFNYSIESNEEMAAGKDPVMILLAIYCANRWQQAH